MSFKCIFILCLAQMVPLGPRMRNWLTSFALAARDAGGCGPGGVVPDRRGGGRGVKCVFYGRDFVSD